MVRTLTGKGSLSRMYQLRGQTPAFLSVPAAFLSPLAPCGVDFALYLQGHLLISELFADTVAC